MKKYLALLGVAAITAFGVGCQTDEADEPAGAERQDTMQTSTNIQWDSQSDTQLDSDSSNIDDGGSSDTSTDYNSNESSQP